MGDGFARRLREATWDDHEIAAQAPYLRALSSGRLDRADYAALVAQHHAIYTALEAAASQMAQDPYMGWFVREELLRLPALEADLVFLLGDDWRAQVSTTPGTQEYVDRLRAVADQGWATRFLAHHYVRYLGDLSGGLVIGPAVEAAFGLADHAGARFYVFDRIPDPAAFKAEYRRRLDRLPWSEEDHAETVGEALEAYRLNREVLGDLSRLVAS